MVLTTVIPFRKGRKKGSGVDYVDLGLSDLTIRIGLTGSFLEIVLWLYYAYCCISIYF